ncbi:hypothetical protein [Microseira sp. BLCC-F43]|jgi:hypothetical protein|uniref:hypothetical protein n=1 Tax=Microseira sp. BLCC-F43 TaxID=3153602 RepID=UPI0035B8B6ED
MAIAKDYTFQETLLSAANSAPRHQGETAWEIAVTLLEKVGVELVNRATEITVELLLRCDNSASWHFNRALQAIKNRSPASEHNPQESYHIWGKFIGYYAEKRLKLRDRTIDIDILASLKEHYFLFGSQIRATAFVPG